MASRPTSMTKPPPSDPRAQQTSIALEIALLALLALIWGGSFTLIKVAIDTVPPVTMVAARVTVAALLLALLAKMRGYALPHDHIASGLAGVLNATPPMFVLLI